MPNVLFKQSGRSISCEAGAYLPEDAKAILLAAGMAADAIYHEQFY